MSSIRQESNCKVFCCKDAKTRFKMSLILRSFPPLTSSFVRKTTNLHKLPWKDETEYIITIFPHVLKNMTSKNSLSKQKSISNSD